MDKNLEERLKACQSSWSELGATFIEYQRAQSEKSREKTQKALGYLWDAYLILCGVLGRALTQTEGNLNKFEDEHVQREALFSAFVIGLEPLELTIMSGRYLQAHALLRQEIDTLVQLQALDQGKRVKGKVLNWNLLNDPSLQRLYDDLSAATHLSKDHVLFLATEYNCQHLDVPEGTKALRSFPVFQHALSRQSFAVHLLVMLRVLHHLEKHHSRYSHLGTDFQDTDRQAMNFAMELMEAEGLVEFSH